MLITLDGDGLVDMASSLSATAVEYGELGSELASIDASFLPIDLAGELAEVTSEIRSCLWELGDACGLDARDLLLRAELAGEDVPLYDSYAQLFAASGCCVATEPYASYDLIWDPGLDVLTGAAMVWSEPWDETTTWPAAAVSAAWGEGVSPAADPTWGYGNILFPPTSSSGDASPATDPTWGYGNILFPPTAGSVDATPATDPTWGYGNTLFPPTATGETPGYAGLSPAGTSGAGTSDDFGYGTLMASHSPSPDTIAFSQRYGPILAGTDGGYYAPGSAPITGFGSGLGGAFNPITSTTSFGPVIGGGTIDFTETGYDSGTVTTISNWPTSQPVPFT